MVENFRRTARRYAGISTVMSSHSTVLLSSDWSKFLRTAGVSRCCRRIWKCLDFSHLFPPTSVAPVHNGSTQLKTKHKKKIHLIWILEFFQANFSKFTTISVSGWWVLYSKLVESLHVQVWSVNFTIFFGFSFGGFLQFGPAVQWRLQ